MQGARIGVCILGSDGTILDISPNICQFFGYQPEELLGQPIQRLVTLENPIEALNLKHSHHFTTIWHMRHNLGHNLYSIITAYSIKENNWVITLWDIDEEYRSSLNYEEDMMLAHILLEDSPNIICIFDRDGHIVRANRHLRELFGFDGSEKEFILFYNNLVQNDAKLQYFATLACTVASTLEYTISEDSYVFSDNTEHFFKTVRQPLYRNSGDVQVLCLAIDISTNKQSIATAQALQNLFTNLSDALHVDDMVSAVLSNSNAIFGSVACSVLKLEDEHLRFLGSTGYTSEQIANWKLFPLSLSVPLCDAIKHKKALFLDRNSLIKAYPNLPLSTSHGFIAAIPLINQGIPYGVLGLSFNRSHAFQPTEEAFILVTAAHCAAALARAEQYTRLQESEERMRNMVENLPFGAIYIDKFGFFFNRTIENMLGYAPENIPTLEDWFKTVYFENSKDAYARYLERQKTGFNSPNTHKLRHKDGSIRVVEFAGYRYNDCEIWILHDVTKHQHTQDQLTHLIYYDPLTDLPNRNLLVEEIKTRCQPITDTNQSNIQKIAILHLDIDRFKIINDLYGHTTGDAILMESGRRLLSITHKNSILAHLSADEFIFVLPIEDISEAARFSNLVLGTFDVPFLINDLEIQLTASIGISLYPNDANDCEGLLSHASTALDDIKTTGGSGIQFYTPELNQRIAESRMLERELRIAIEKNTLELYYQPQFDIKSQTIIGAEGLLRWRHPTLGMVSPAQFIPLAEETGLIHSLGQWVINTACKQLKKWNGNNLRLAINVSAQQFIPDDFIDSIQNTISLSKINPCLLEIEITETTLMKESNSRLLIDQLKSLGVELSIDDFGTGYSNLGQLKKFAVDRLKIDKSFIQDLPHSDTDKALVKAVIALGHAFHLKVLAEGVETPEQLAILRELGCDEVQGYLLGSPMPVHNFDVFYRLRQNLSTEPLA